ncbi:39S ribosomal protein L10, mitochondrial isoform X1 [Diorhabda carinulata]|uniref:39S ribosomal protein L10, mitochondrial isoform X1 n=1 Tax=Diorhabda carinulata TaxID=1163345 RepID=UPI0025A1D32C|nr:39S ribosomal protein L10, mitochondrial isoform X1 [Diorhabda carinulata]
MALLYRKAFLQSLTPFIQCKRFRGKVNIQRPKPPHFEKAKYLALTQPWFINPNKNKPLVELCRLNRKLEKKKDLNPLRDIYAKELYNSFKNSKLIVFYHFNSMKADENFRNYALFKKQGMELKKYEREMLSAAVSGTPYETVLDFYVTSNNMILFCPEPEVNKVLKISKKCPQLIMLGKILYITLYSLERKCQDSFIVVLLLCLVFNNIFDHTIHLVSDLICLQIFFSFYNLDNWVTGNSEILFNSDIFIIVNIIAQYLMTLLQISIY